jgi:creatinine amidohydrolase
MASRAATEWRYEKLTRPVINDAVDLYKICIVPCGAVEQHGPHLPLDVDLVCPVGVASGAGRQIPDKVLVLPVVAYGYGMGGFRFSLSPRIDPASIVEILARVS